MGTPFFNTEPNPGDILGEFADHFAFVHVPVGVDRSVKLLHNPPAHDCIANHLIEISARSTIPGPCASSTSSTITSTPTSRRRWRYGPSVGETTTTK